MTKLNGKHFACLAVIVATVLVFFLVPALTQNMENEGRALTDLAEPRIVIRKKARTLELYDGAELIKTYTMVLGFAPTGDKEREGDGKTPEGEFYVFTKNSKSKFHLSLGLSYPSIEDARRGVADGAISRAEHDAILQAIEKGEMPPQKTALGGEIYIHGGGTQGDWTWGCVALKNEEIEELFKTIPVGTRVQILP